MIAGLGDEGKDIGSVRVNFGNTPAHFACGKDCEIEESYLFKK